MNDPIQFYCKDISYQPRAKGSIRDWLKLCAKKEKCTIENLHFIFCSDDHLHQLNLKFLKHDTLTDVITFHYDAEKNDAISGEVYISVPRVKENARENEVLIHDELHRIMAHGLLHLIGYDDKNKAAKQRMTMKEDYFLSLRHRNLR
ncbi:MAG: rRNA maturation RNase YbeY [Bacteroidia bacterium]|nr:rRNA maturation RNase YbeY [Bacteroidia bacterium]